uniref:BHLH domain-containing protein n=1 Tax=Oryza meridionalis TaxID=40149 RepID=A0A0E0D8L9_9ORYZ
MFPVEVAAAAGAGRMQGEAVVPMMLPPFFMDSGIWPAAAAAGGVVDVAASAEDEAAAAAAAQDRALAASRNHREAEKRRRERIKSHLDRLRAIDKASLLAKAVERVRDLKQRMAGIGEAAPAHLFPTEHDEIVVLASGGGGGVGGAAAVFEASVCCDDRSDLLPELIETLRALRLRTLRAEMATLGGRVRNVLVLARDGGAGEGGDGDGDRADYSAVSNDGGDFLKEALRALVERPGAAAGDRPKRRRVVSDMNMQAAA